MVVGAGAMTLNAAHHVQLHDLIEMVERGLPVIAVDNVIELVNAPRSAVLSALDLSERTLARRRIDGQLTASESDRVMRLLRLLDRASTVLGDGERARRWLQTPARAFDGRTPFALASTETGAAAVFDLLGRIEDGVFS